MEKQQKKEIIKLMKAILELIWQLVKLIGAVILLVMMFKSLISIF